MSSIDHTPSTSSVRDSQEGKILFSFFLFLHKVFRSVAIRVLPKTLIHPRSFSNVMIRKYGGVFSGDMINVSGWDDRDSEDGYYRDYFLGHKRYVISNFAIADKGFGSVKSDNLEEIELDLEKPLREELRGAFDVVFNHTTLEHIPAFEIAFKNLCDMSRDAVIIVVPLLQQIHIAPTFGDYWRPTALGVYKLFRKHGFTPLVIKTNDQPFYPVYCFAIAVRNPKKYVGRIEQTFDFQSGGALFGSSMKPHALEALLREIKHQ